MALNLKPLLIVYSLLVSGLLAIPPAEAQLGGLRNLLGFTRIQGTVYCTANGNIGVNGAATTVFSIKYSNAPVQLQCRGRNVVSSTTTNSSGSFSMKLGATESLLLSLLSNCNIVVNAAPVTCNATLPAGGILQSGLNLVSGVLGGLGISDLIPAGFSFLPIT
ncbi:phylloplanin-like [Telopea speciosissima]|uniref:phylloplanin-like n=1 Tax=Telopea speciosissima TaxID=54955 RepID=UPI001CC5AD5F|nr:phylloplanin-like [Telopea speciosissima]